MIHLCMRIVKVLIIKFKFPISEIGLALSSTGNLYITKVQTFVRLPWWIHRYGLCIDFISGTLYNKNNFKDSHDLKHS